MVPMSEDEVRGLFSEVKIVPNGLKVIFPYGAKIVEFRGEKVLQSLTIDEYKSSYLSDFGKELDVNNLFGCVMYNFPDCISNGDCDDCRLFTSPASGNIYCDCYTPVDVK